MLLENLKLDDSVKNQDEDFVPGSDFSLPTGLYPFIVDMAYMGESQAGAVSITVHLKEVGGKRTLRETFYVTSRKQADGSRRNTYIDKRTQKVRPLPGMATANALAQVTCSGKKLHQLVPEEKTINLWNYDLKKAVPTPVPALMEMIGQPVLVAVVKKRENKRTKVGKKYIDTNVPRTFNECTKFLYPNGATIAETAAGNDERAWRTKWESAFDADYVLDKFLPITDADEAMETASSNSAEASSQEVTALFGTDNTEESDPVTDPALVAENASIHRS